MAGYRSPKTTKENTLKERNNLMQTKQIMSQAKTLTPTEVDQVLNYISTQSFPLRNRAMFLTGLWSGMRVGEIASLSVGNVMNSDGTVKAEIRLTADQTKGRQPRTVFLPQKLRDELQSYIALRQPAIATHPLFVTAGRKRFSANVMAQHFHYLFNRAGLAGASSHSMRRTFLTSLTAKGIGIRVLAALAGHRNLQVTLKYLDASDDMKRNAVELI
jgi:integrase/recombinase XerD